MTPTSKQDRRVSKVNLLLSVLIAFAAWVYVAYSVDPTISRTYDEVPVSLTGEEELADNELAVSTLDTASVSVSLSGKRSAFRDIDAEDIQAVVDVRDAGKGENTLALTITPPEGLNLSGQSDNSVTVTVEALKTKTVRAEALFEDSDDAEPIVTEQSAEEVEVSGAESLVDKVAYVELPLRSDQVQDSEKTFSVSGVPVNKEGTEIQRVTVNPSKVAVTAINGKTKTVKLKLQVNNPSDDDYERSYTAPEEITIKGLAEDLEGVTELRTEVIDLSGITSSQDIAMSYDLPEGISIASASQGLKLSVKVTKSEKKEISVAAADIQIEHLGSGLSAEAENGVTIVVTGTSTQVSAVNRSDFTVRVDASGLGTGRHTLQAVLSGGDTVKRAELEDAEVTINIEG